jgi:hypothetical protein
MTTWAIVVAHATKPCDHWQAQALAEVLLASEGMEKQLENYHPCIVFGIKGARRYWVDQGRLGRQLYPCIPTCVTHGEMYTSCQPDCIYGVRLDEQWVHELMEHSP